MLPHLGRMLLLAGVVLAIAGAVLMLAPRTPWLGRLPGDLVIRRGGTTVFLPLATSILLSIVLTLVLTLLLRRR